MPQPSRFARSLSVRALACPALVLSSTCLMLLAGGCNSRTRRQLDVPIDAKSTVELLERDLRSWPLKREGNRLLGEGTSTRRRLEVEAMPKRAAVNGTTFVLAAPLTFGGSLLLLPTAPFTSFHLFGGPPPGPGYASRPFEVEIEVTELQPRGGVHWSRVTMDQRGMHDEFRQGWERVISGNLANAAQTPPGQFVLAARRR